jgi:IS30 family transposase
MVFGVAFLCATLCARTKLENRPKTVKNRSYLGAKKIDLTIALRAAPTNNLTYVCIV